jgi:CheY-like chemotaxis protein
MATERTAAEDFHSPALRPEERPARLAKYEAPCSILIVDANEVSRDILAATLEQAGYEAPVVGTAADAENAVRYGRPDLILQSLTLPDARWWDLPARLPRSANIPILGYACVLPAEARGNYKHGFAGFLTKPFAPAYLVRSLPFYLWNKPVPELAPLAPAAANSETVASKATVAEPARGRESVLIVEDNEFQRERLHEAFLLGEFQVAMARHGIDALEKLGKNRPDVVVSDTLMTGCDGFELCLAMRRLEALKRLPVVLTPPNQVDPIDERVARAVGADAYIGRTGGFDRLLDAARTLARLAGRADAPRLAAM